MANLTDNATWEAGVFQLETTTPALGGAGGPMNTQGQQLANRTAYLKEQVEARLPLAGGTMSGNLTISRISPVVFLQRSAAGQVARLEGRIGTSRRWLLDLGDDTPETGSNAGSQFRIGYFSDADIYTDAALSISRQDGRVTLRGDPTANLHAATKQYVDARRPALHVIPNYVAWAAGPVDPGDGTLFTTQTVAAGTRHIMGSAYARTAHPTAGAAFLEARLVNNLGEIHASAFGVATVQSDSTWSTICCPYSFTVGAGVIGTGWTLAIWSRRTAAAAILDVASAFYGVTE